ncbi:unnamed protein product [Effrenium voratum]|nr:unnamed protein product [Effrenium voratum]
MAGVTVLAELGNGLVLYKSKEASMSAVRAWIREKYNFTPRFPQMPGAFAPGASGALLALPADGGARPAPVFREVYAPRAAAAAAAARGGGRKARLHNTDRRLEEWRQLPHAPRLMLHCWRLRVENVEVMAPVEDAELAEQLASPEAQQAAQELMSERPEETDLWDKFAGGLLPHILDDTPWDCPRELRNARGPPYRPTRKTRATRGPAVPSS